jgi:predicted permease
MNQLLVDIRHALRGIFGAPLFTALAVASIALGIGASTAIFTLVDQIVLRPLPVERPHELALVRIEGRFDGNTWGAGNELSYPMYMDLRDHNTVFSGMFSRFGWSMHLGVDGRTERVEGELVSGTYFPVLGVRAAAGRLLTPDDDRVPGGHSVAVLSYRYWQTRFKSDPAVVGQKIAVNGHPFTVIGVAARGFDGLDIASASQVFVPMMMKPQMTPGWNFLDDRRSRFARVFGRLRPGVSHAQAKAGLQPFFREIRARELKDAYFAKASEYARKEFQRATLEVEPGFQGYSNVRELIASPLWVLMAIAGGVLLIACANVAGLLVARGLARQRELAIRLALGASRWRVVRQLLVESLILALMGGAAGILVAAWGCTLLLGVLVPPETIMGVSSTPDGRVLLFTLLVAILAAVMSGLVPAWQATRPTLAPTLKDQSGTVVGGGQVRLRKALVIAQVALSLLLLIGAGLFIRSLQNLLAQDPGFKTTNLVTFMVDPSLNGYSPQQTKQFAKRLVERTSSLPGVRVASITSVAILMGGSWSSTMTVEGYTAREDEDVVAYSNTVLPGYFQTMGIPLLVGRDFAVRDERLTPAPERESDFRVAIANQRFVERYFGKRNPIGRHVGFGGAPGTPTPIEIVGVVGTSKYVAIRDEAEPQLFFPFLEGRDPRLLVVYVRTTQEPETMFASLRQLVQGMDPALPVFEMRTMEEQVELSLFNERLVAGLSTVFGLLATLLAVVGIYGVMAYTVTRRTREIGIRVALGALSSRVAWLFVREAALLVIVGFVIALPLGWWLAHYVQTQLFGVRPLDPFTIALAMLGLGSVAAAGALVPALRAARIDPLTALREE